MEQVDNFIYPGRTQSTTSSSQADITRRIALASLVMSSLQQVWTAPLVYSVGSDFRSFDLRSQFKITLGDL